LGEARHQREVDAAADNAAVDLGAVGHVHQLRREAELLEVALLLHELLHRDIDAARGVGDRHRPCGRLRGHLAGSERGNGQCAAEDGPSRAS